MAERYSLKHGGCAIVIGAAPCVFEDLEAARALRPDAVLLGVNNAAAMVDGIEHVWTQHGDHAEQFKANAPHIKVHARPRTVRSGSGLWFFPVSAHLWKSVDYEWPSLSWVSGSSGVAGALWAKHGMGFNEVIMAGIPLSGFDYAAAYPSEPTKATGWAEPHQLKIWLDRLQEHRSAGRAHWVFSMSGATREILGAPQ